MLPAQPVAVLATAVVPIKLAASDLEPKDTHVDVHSSMAMAQLDQTVVTVVLHIVHVALGLQQEATHASVVSLDQVSWNEA